MENGDGFSGSNVPSELLNTPQPTLLHCISRIGILNAGLILGTRAGPALLAGQTPSFQPAKTAACPLRELLWYVAVDPKRPFEIPIPPRPETTACTNRQAQRLRLMPSHQGVMPNDTT